MANSVLVMDLLIRGGTLVTCDAHNTVIEGDLLVQDGRIKALGPNAGKTAGPVRVLQAHGCAVIPGFVQAHVHLCQVLFRGMADDLPLLEWLRERIWPLEAAHDERSLLVSAELGLTELLLGGTTTILDMGTVQHTDAVFDAMERSGIRGYSGNALMDVTKGLPKNLRKNTKATLEECERLHKRWHNSANGRLRYAPAPRFILSCTEKLIRSLVEWSTDRKVHGKHPLLLHSHAAEHPGERDAVRELFGGDDVDVLASWGLEGPHTIFAHGVQLTDKQAKRAAEVGTRFVHCPSANLKLGSGIARVHELRSKGLLMALGADGAPCNNNLDALLELRHAALLSKVAAGTTTLPAMEALRMATIDGAKALHLDAEIGSLEVGKRADLAVVDLSGVHCEPGGDAVSRIVYAARSSDVQHVLIDGKLVVRHRELRTLDREGVLARAREQAPVVRARAGLA